MSGYTRAMKRFATFDGRASRAEFWQFTAIVTLIGVVALIIDGAIGREIGVDQKDSPGGIVTLIVVLVHVIPSFTVTVRRLHDVNRTGWLVFLNLIPPVNLVILVLACLRGTPGANRFGPDPLDFAGQGHVPAKSPSAAGGAPTAILGASVSPGRRDLIAELERLGRLRKDGHLSDAEFEVMKAESLAQSRSA